jgi:hypothetical protein
MALTIEDHAVGSMGLSEFIEFVDKSYDELSVESLIELRDLSAFQKDSPYSAQSLSLGGVHKKFYLRANVWLPKRELHSVNDAGEANLYSYDFAHDHNFDFLTVGYFGPGYETDIYEYDVREVRGEVGEVVDMKFLESTSLPYGKMMIYRASRDVHVQKFPCEFSISLNLLTPGKEPIRDQFAFDLRTRAISSVIRSNLSGRSLLMEAAAALGDRDTDDMIQFIADSHHCCRTREAAARALSTARRARALPAETANISS